MRVYSMGKEDIEKIRKARQRMGNAQYGNKDLKRYNVLDCVEEICDCKNILTNRFVNRILNDEGHMDSELLTLVVKANEAADDLMKVLQRIDYHTPETSISDQNGGDRIGFNKK